MLLGTSYSLITDSVVSKETYGFEVANFNVEFLDDTKITISGVPLDDTNGFNKSKEFSFTITNNSDYDVNYRLDILENGNTNMGEVIHYAYSVNDSEYSKIYNLGDNYTIKQNKVLGVNAIDTYKIKMWLSDEADESYMNKTFSATISLMATQNEYKYATNVIEKLANENQDGIKNVNGEYRYSLKNSMNYVWFNCQDGFNKGENYCEKWRIVGSFNNHKENTLEEYKMLKIVSDDVYDEIAFNNEEKTGDYSESYIESFANGSYYDKLNDNAKKLILKAKWNIGSIKSNTYESVLQEENEGKSYYGNVGLLNVSDYLYLQDNSYIKSDNVLLLNKNLEDVSLIKGSLTTGNNTSNYNFLPCVYLRPDVSIISGDGTSDNPYEINIKFPMNY